MSDGLLPIGMFSRASSLSIKALRAYQEHGILVPAVVDAQTGYRSYTADQLADAAIIVRLRALDVPLDQVRDVLIGRDPEITRRILAAHQRTMQDRLVETERIVAELQSGLAPTTHTPVHIREEPATVTVRCIGVTPPAEFSNWLDDAFGRLRGFLADAGVTAAGPLGALYPAEIDDDDLTSIEALIPIHTPLYVPTSVIGVSIGEVPAAQVAVLVHAGGYDTIDDTYRSLGAWVARHGEHAGEPVREWYLIGPGDADDASAFRTEISWPVKRTGSITS